MTKFEELSGRPIRGEIRPTEHDLPKQDDPRKVIEALDALLDLPGVISYKWTQYTPYWMDGEPCEFWTLTDYRAGVKLEFGDPEGGESEDGFYTSYNLRYKDELNGHEISEELKNALRAIEGKISNSHHFVWLKETFGDHASVIATKDGFEVEFYDHD
jgi:hypothetical protein